MKSKRNYNLISQIRSALRRVWLWSPMRRDALNKAKVRPGYFRCCVCKSIKARKLIAVDHKSSATPLEGLSLDNLHIYVKQLFVPANELQVMCKEPCHKEKTREEREKKKKYKASKTNPKPNSRRR